MIRGTFTKELGAVTLNFIMILVISDQRILWTFYLYHYVEISDYDMRVITDIRIALFTNKGGCFYNVSH